MEPIAIDWTSVFERHLAPGASEAEVQCLQGDVSRPLSTGEVATIVARQRNPFPPQDPLHAHFRPFDPMRWALPASPLPAAYLAFLRWSNGGSFRTGER
jgi:hypothetical protein